MNVTNIIKAVCQNVNKVIQTKPLTQYDYGQKLMFENVELPTAFEVHFSDDPRGEAVTVIGQENTVDIPDIYLQKAGTIFAWVYLHTGEADGETVLRVEIPVRPRAEITDREIKPVEIDVIAQTIAALNMGVEKAETAQSTAEAAQTAAETAQAGAEDAKQAIEDLGVEAETLEPGSEATVEKTVDDNGVVTLKFGVPEGLRGFTGNGIAKIEKAWTQGLVDTYVITYTDGNTARFTVTNGEKGDIGNGIMSIHKTGQDGLTDIYTITYSNGVTTNYHVKNGEKGDTGNGIETAVLNADYTLTITFTDGNTYTTPPIRGIRGNGITGAVLNVDHTLTLTFTDGDSYTTPSIKGDKGDTGLTPDMQIGTVETLPEGSDVTASFSGTSERPVLHLGIPVGTTGATGNGVQSIMLNADNTITVTYTDGTSYTSGSVKGDTGRGIQSFAKTATEGLADTYTVTYTDGTTTVFTILNGEKGDTGKTPNLTIGTVNEGPAAATITGTRDDPVLNLTLPPANTSDIILVQDTQPTQENNKLWLPATAPEGIQVMTAAETKAALETKVDKEDAEGIEDAATEATGQMLLEYETAGTLMEESLLETIGTVFDNLPQDETATDILHSLKLEVERLNAIYENWLSEKEGT